MTDIERAAFEEWYRGAKDIDHPNCPLHRWNFGDGPSSYRNQFVRAYWEGWQARASRPVVVTDEMVEAGARASWLHQLYPCNDAAWDASKTEYPDAYAREIRTMRISLSVALNGWT